jgi:bla regulator protein BlaR1
MRASWLRLSIAAFFAAGAIPAQQPALPAYEVAVVKPNNSGSGSSSSNGSKGQVVMTNLTLKRLIGQAYSVKPFQVSGPDWMETEHFDIVAKYPPDTKNEDRPLMLRAFLEDRFKLVTHRESKSMPGYELVVAKSGFKLTPVPEAGGPGTNSRGGRIQILTVKQTSMPMLADLVSRSLGEMVVDKTGKEGVYDFELRWTSDLTPPANDADTAPSLFTVIQETLGLRLQPQKVPVPMVVVDHLDKVPVET